VSAAEATPREDQLAAGAVVGGRFVVERRLGIGGMGVVYAAQDQVIDRKVALKVLTLGTAKARARFRQEAAAASRISSRFVSAIHDFGRDEALGVEYIVMELLEGQTLGEVLAESGMLSVSQAAAVGGDIAEALAAAHAAGVVHRDLKPGNVWLLGDGGVKVIDFGIARVDSPTPGPDDPGGITNPDAIVGTPRYISPEAVEGAPIDARADLYSLGVLLYELIAGRPPFLGKVATALCTAHYRDPPPPLDEVAPDVDVPSALEALVMALLEKDPARRPQSASEVAAILHGLGAEAPPRPFAAGSSGDGAQTAIVSRADVAPSRRGPLLAAIAIATLVIGLLAVVVVLVFRSPENAAHPVASPEPTPTPAPTPSSTPSSTPTPRPAPTPSTIEVPVAVVPPQAALTLDGEPVDAPLTLPADDTEHTLEVTAPGYAPETRTLRGDRDRSVTVHLRRRPRPRRGRRDLPAKLREW